MYSKNDNDDFYSQFDSIPDYSHFAEELVKLIDSALEQPKGWSIIKYYIANPGCSCKECADALNVSQHYINYHRKQIVKCYPLFAVIFKKFTENEK